MSFLDCRDKVRDEVNNQFNLGAVSRLTPQYDAEEVKDLTVFVIPFEQFPQRVTRAKTEIIYTIQIAIIQKINKDTTDESVLAVSTSVMEHFFNKNLPAGQSPPTYHSGQVSSIPFYDYQELDEDRIVVSIIQIEYREQI